MHRVSAARHRAVGALKMPRGIANFFMNALIRSPLHVFLGGNLAVVTVRGRKTGRLYSVPVNVAREGDTCTIVSLRRRTWWRNLRDGALAELRVSGKRYAVRGEVVEGQEQVVDGLTNYFREHPGSLKHFGMRVTAEGGPAQADVQRVAQDRVLIRLRRIQAM